MGLKRQTSVTVRPPLSVSANLNYVRHEVGLQNLTNIVAKSSAMTRSLLFATYLLRDYRNRRDWVVVANLQMPGTKTIPLKFSSVSF